MLTIVRPVIGFDLPWARPFVQWTRNPTARFILNGVEQCPEPEPCPDPDSPTYIRLPDGYTLSDLKLVATRVRLVSKDDKPCPIILKECPEQDECP